MGVKEIAEQMLWHEKYRPRKIEDCILPDKAKKFFMQQRDDKVVQNMLLHGSHGVGKTTIAKALCDELGADVLFLNCSKDSGIDTLRTTMNQFATSMSLSGGQKVIIGDEFDHFNAQGQAALRGVIEQVSNNCRFIFTCNYPNKIIDPLHSRLTAVDFRIKSEVKPKMAGDFFKRVITILDAENVEYDKRVIAEVVKKRFPDFRKVLGELQGAALMGPIDISFLQESNSDFEPYIEALKKKDFKKARAWIGENSIDASDFFSTLFKQTTDIFDEESYAQAILTLNEGQFKHHFVVDEELSLAALTIELMSSCKFK